MPPLKASVREMMNAPKTLTIEELAAIAGISCTMVDFYVRSKLLEPPVENATEVTFTQSHVQRLSIIKDWQDDGINRAEMLQRLRGFRNPWYCQSTN
jgi:DNA-binding transcriptional MerR regulator